MIGVDPTARVEIAELNARFAWALDLRDYETLRDILTADVHYVGASGEFTDVDSLIRSFRSRAAGRITRHALGNLLLEPSDSGCIRGRASWHTFASNTLPADGVRISMVADFHDIYTTHSDGSWRISERIIRPIFHEPALAPRGDGLSGPAGGDTR